MPWRERWLISQNSQYFGSAHTGRLAVTTRDFHLLLEEGGIRSWIQNKQLEIVSEEDVDPVSKELQDRILNLSIPPKLEEAILRHYDCVAERAGTCIPMAVRSSAVV